MKKTGAKYLLKTIRKNLVSFIAVAFIAAISIAIYLGLQAGATATLRAGDRYFTDHRLHSLEIRSNVGFTQSDLDRLHALEGVDLAEGARSLTVTLEGEEEKIILNALSLCEGMNTPVLLEGALPSAPDEIAIEEMMANKTGLQVGDAVRLSHGGYLAADEFRITAVINLPAYCCLDVSDARGNAEEGLGAAAFYAALPMEAFLDSGFFGRYTAAYVRNDALDALFDYSDEYAQAEQALIDRVAALNSNWTVSGRGNTGDLRAFRVLVDSIYGLSYVLSIIFVLVAVVVCHAAVSRMIFEQRSFIGVQKALGFTTAEVLRHYALYNLICAGLGILLGCLMGIFIVENVVVSIFGQEFSLQSIPLIFPYAEAAIAAVICLGIFLLTTWMGCRSLSRQQAIDLLREEVSAGGKRRFFESFPGYQKMNLYTRTMIKNVLHDPARMMTTVVGVVGCISLLVICLGLKMGIEDSSVRQFARYFLYDHRLVVSSSEGDPAAFQALLGAQGIPHAVIHDKLKNFQVEGGQWENGHLVAVEDSAALEGFMVLEDIRSGEVLTAPSDGVLVSRKCAEVYGLQAGSTVDFVNSRGEMRSLRIAGVIEHYLPYPLFVTTADYYAAAMGEAADPCVFLLKGDIAGLRSQAAALPGFMSLKDNSSLAAQADQVNMVIWLCLALAAVMSLLVLLNQIVLHINRKARELAVMRINGYTLKETRAYVYKDNIVLTVIGLLLGCGTGSFLSWLAICILEGEVNRYVRDFNPTACLFGIAVGSVFALAVNLIALRKISRLSLTHVSSN